ncbi:hypothetical protein ACQY0O_007497 [Thecaphora frezii]
MLANCSPRPTTPSPTAQPTAAHHTALLFHLLSLSSSSPHHTPEHVQRSIPLAISTEVPAGRGLIFTADVRPDQLLLSIPARSLLNPSNLGGLLHPSLIPSNAQEGEEEVQSTRLSSAQALSLVLARWRASRRQSTATPTLTTSACDDDDELRRLDLFAQTLPQRFDTVPLFWHVYSRSASASAAGSGSDGATPSLGQLMNHAASLEQYKARFYTALLSALPRHSLHLLWDIRRRFDADWASVCGLMRDSPWVLCLPTRAPSLSPSSSPSSSPSASTAPLAGVALPTLSDFLWAWLSVNSRCIYFPLSLSTHSDNLTMAPLLDMANHTSLAAVECKVRYDVKKGLELYAPPASARSPAMGTRGLRKGDECFITYGAHSNAALLAEYGFVLPPSSEEGEEGEECMANRYCEVAVDQEVEGLFEEQGQQGRRKMELLRERGYWSDFTLHPTPSPAHPSYRLVPALRLLAIPLASPTLDTPPITKAPRLSHPTPSSKRRPRGAPTPPQRSTVELDMWESTLTGHAPLVSVENEAEAHMYLVKLCDRVAQAYDRPRRGIEQAAKVLDELGPEAGEEWEALKAALDAVRQLVMEEVRIVQHVREAALRGEEW